MGASTRERERFLGVVFRLGCGGVFSLVADETVDDQAS
jgi:hypothetical protein